MHVDTLGVSPTPLTSKREIMVNTNFEHDSQLVPTVKEIGDIAGPIAREIGASELYLFGSMARGTADSNSDIDFIYAVPQDAPLEERARISRQLRMSLREAFNRDVDLVRKTYLTTPNDVNATAELIRQSFIKSINENPIYRIL